MPNYEIVTMKNKVTVKCANQKMEQDLVITYKDALSSENALKKLLDYTKSCYYCFYNNKEITDLTGYLEYKDTENVTDMCYMFYQCSNLTTIPSIDTSNAIKMNSMFRDCSKLEIVPTINTSKATDIDSLFSGCNSLKFVPRITIKAKSIMNLFYGCNMLEKIDLSSLDTVTQATGYTVNLAGGCNSLKKFIIREMTKVPALNTNAFEGCYHLTGTKNTTYNPNGDKDCYIYVPDNMVDTLKSATNWSTYASQIKPLSELVED